MNLLPPPHNPKIGTYRSYVLGYILCLLLTAVAFLMATPQNTVWIIAFGILQIGVQLFLFFHLHTERKPHWNLIVFLFMLLVMVILVVGSLWIMANLDYRMMPVMR